MYLTLGLCFGLHVGGGAIGFEGDGAKCLVRWVMLLGSWLPIGVCCATGAAGTSLSRADGRSDMRTFEAIGCNEVRTALVIRWGGVDETCWKRLAEAIVPHASQSNWRSVRHNETIGMVAINVHVV